MKLGSTELEVSGLCLGGNVFGWTADREQSFAVLDAFVEAGGNFIDTADCYASWLPGSTGGESETIIGDWMRSRRNRDEMVIATKVGQLDGYTKLDTKTVNAAVMNSLRRLGTDRIDLYYAHEDDQSTSLAETAAALDAVVRLGAVRYIGASNFGSARLAQAIEFSKAHGLATYVVLQNHYNLLFRGEYEDGPAPLVRSLGLTFIPYFSLAEGYLTGKYRGSAEVASERSEDAANYASPRTDRVLDVVARIASTRQVAMAAVALAWLASKPEIQAPLASARPVAQLRQSAASLTLALSSDEVAELDSVSAA